MCGRARAVHAALAHRPQAHTVPATAADVAVLAEFFDKFKPPPPPFPSPAVAGGAKKRKTKKPTVDP